ncbi:tetratricopeptide repeat protein [Burkholderiaceae bacterium UC74_6]
MNIHLNALIIVLGITVCGASAAQEANSKAERDRIVALVRKCNPNDEYYNQQNVDACTAALAEPSLARPVRALTLNVRGNTYDALGKHDLAIADYTEVARLLPDSAIGYGNLGLEYCRKGDFKKALRFFDEALQRDPKYTFAMYGKGVALSHLGQTVAAREQLERANKADPGMADVYRQIKMPP